jgi:hypothetical protein
VVTHASVRVDTYFLPGCSDLFCFCFLVCVCHGARAERIDDWRPKAISKAVGCRCLFVGYGSAVLGRVFAEGLRLKIRLLFTVRVQASARELPFPFLGQSNPLQRMNSYNCPRKDTGELETRTLASAAAIRERSDTGVQSSLTRGVAISLFD